jgi:DNA-binding NarL/FixJ family response regulator
MKSITVLLAEDHAIVRQGLRKLLEAENDIQVIGEAATGRQAVEIARKLLPDVVVMDIAMPLLNGLEATRQILRVLPNTKVLILSAHSDHAYVEQVTSFGATGYLVKQASAQFLAQAIRAVRQGKTFYSPSISKEMSNRLESSPDPAGRLKKRGESLTSREIEVLQLIAEGSANKQVAAELGISVKTVEKHRQTLMEKLNIHDTAGLTRFAIGTGIIENEVLLTLIDDQSGFAGKSPRTPGEEQEP